MIKFFIKNMANSTIEFSLLMVVVILGFISMQAYFKRGLQGGWHRQVDQVADQFAFGRTEISTYAIELSNQTEIQGNGTYKEILSQDVFRITNETINSTDGESQMRI